MSSFGGKGGGSQAAQTPAAAGLQIQTSVLGNAITLLYGATRIAGNLIWYGDFQAIAHQSTPPGGGKGGVTGGGGKSGSGGTTTYSYTTGVAIGLCEGPISNIGQIFSDKQVFALSDLGFSLFTGTYVQAPWGVLTTSFPSQALNYPGIAYVAVDPLNLNDTPTLQNYNFEVFGRLYGTSPNGVDADPSQVISDLLTNVDYGAGFPSARLGSFTTYQNYVLALGLWISPGYTQQTSASQLLDEIATNTNSAFVWSGGLLTLVPYGDTAVTGNGHTYTPPMVPSYDLTDDDFLPNVNASGSSGSNNDPVVVTRKRPADALNNIKLEYLDRSNQYNPAIAESFDQAAIDLFGRRTDGARTAHLFCDGAAARMSVQLQLQREAIRNVYEFTLGQRYILLDPMDIVTLTDSALGLNKQWVRITEITENDDGTLSFVAEEYLGGAGHAAAYNFSSSTGFSANANAPAPSTNTPLVFAAPVSLAQSSQGLEIWVALSGPSGWGGCDIWISTDNATYTNPAPSRTVGGSRQGALSAPLPNGVDPDVIDAISVDLSMSRSSLLSGTRADADAYHTLCYVGGELISYQTAQLVGTNKYNLSYLRRGAYGTTITSHPTGTQFARLDKSIVVIPYTADQIGKTLYLKFPSFNVYGGGGQTLAQIVTPTTITLPAPPVPPNVTNFSAANNGEVVVFAWDQVADNAIAGYDVRYGPLGVQSWDQMAPLTEAKKGTEMTNASVAPGTWLFAIRARDVAGQFSPLMTTQVLQVVNTNPVLSSQPQAPGWANINVVA